MVLDDCPLHLLVRLDDGMAFLAGRHDVPRFIRTAIMLGNDVVAFDFCGRSAEMTYRSTVFNIPMPLPCAGPVLLQILVEEPNPGARFELPAMRFIPVEYVTWARGYRGAPQAFLVYGLCQFWFSFPEWFTLF
jgi:hypothetical protein